MLTLRELTLNWKFKTSPEYTTRPYFKNKSEWAGARDRAVGRGPNMSEALGLVPKLYKQDMGIPCQCLGIGDRRIRHSRSFSAS